MGTDTMVYPLMIKAYSDKKEDEYKIGLLIGGNLKWQMVS